MPITHLLEDFSSGADPSDVMSLMSEVALEEQRLDSFEKGYSAGWEDAFSTQEKDNTRITGALADGLGDLSFTYQEAMAEFLASLEPVFRSFVDLVLPEALSQTLGHHIVEQLCEMAKDQVSTTVSLMVPIGASAALSPVLDREISMPVKIVESNKVAAGRAFISFDSTEREIDMTALLDSIRESIDAFTHQSNKDLQHG